MAIERFRDEYYFLSSMYPVKQWIETPEGLAAPTVEHVYQASKFPDEALKEVIMAAEDGFKAKQLANGFEEDGKAVRKDWHIAKVDVMRDLVHQKYVRNPRLAYLLLQTGDEEIIEGNTWDDRFWGVCPPGSNNGLNWLGRITMETRTYLGQPKKIKVGITEG